MASEAERKSTPEGCTGIKAKSDLNKLDYDDCDYIPELCQLTFIPTKEVVKPEILVYKGSLKSKEPPSPLVLFDQKLNNSN